MKRLEKVYDHVLWHSDSERLLVSSGILWLAIKEENGKKVKDMIELGHSIDIGECCRRNFVMLLGLSFEVLLKSIILVKSNNKELKTTHNLLVLAKESGISLSKEEEKVFSLISHYIRWVGKYPNSLTKNEDQEFQVLFGNTLANRYSRGNTHVVRYNGRLDWDINKKIWDRINDQYKMHVSEA